jgi:hypothetical protein
MKNKNIMNISSMRGVFLSAIILCSVVLMLIPSSAYAEELNVKSVSIDETAIITVTNHSQEDVKTFRIWLSGDFNFKSFKTEKGWIGEKNPQGVIIFSSSEIIKTGESVKFGIKTDKPNAIINWKGLDQNNQVIKIGVVKSNNLPEINANPEINKNIENTGTTIFSDSTFRVIPDKPNSGATIRLVGEHFGVSQEFSFYIDSKKITNFVTDENGQFITTTKIPDMEKESRVDFKIKGYDNAETKISLRLGNNDNRIPDEENIKLAVEGVSNSVKRGDILEIYGKGTPGSSVIVEIQNPDKIIINTRTTEVDSIGNWKLSNTLNIAFDAPLGKYSIIVSDGRNQILKTWQVVTNKIIEINPTKIMFNAGELIKFNGTAIPNTSLELILENNLGDEVTSDIIEVDESGFIEFEYQSIENENMEGTWTLIATQNKNTEFSYVGYDELPTIPVNLSFDKTNYQSTETAVISFIGKPSDKLTMIIITPSGAIEGKDILIPLREDGRGEHELNLSGWGSGIYTAVIKKGNSQNSERFSVGLQMGSGNIEVSVTQDEYDLGERILLLGKTNPNSLMTAKLFDPNGKEIKKLEIASNSVGTFTEERFKIPSDGKTGIWKIIVASGSNLETIEFAVFSLMSEGLSVKAEAQKDVPGYGKNVKITISASHKTSIIIEITNEQNEIMNTLNCNTTKEFKCQTFWSVPRDTIPGEYTIRAFDSISESQVKFLLK